MSAGPEHPSHHRLHAIDWTRSIVMILIVDLGFIRWLWFPGSILVQVMFAIGLSMVLMVPFRRLPPGGS